jgi:HK97 family phage major capsid protein
MNLKEQLKRAQEKLGQSWEEYRTFRDGLDDDNAKWSSEQREKFDAMDADIDKLEGEIEGFKRGIKDADREERFTAPHEGEHRENAPPAGGEQRDKGAEDESRAFEALLRGGPAALTAEQRDGMSAGSDVSGGFLVTPQQFVKALLQEVDDQVAIRGMATVHTLKKAASLGVVKLDDDLDDWGWTTELKTGSDDDGLGFGKRELRAHPLAKRVKMSETLLRLSDRNIQGLVSGRLAYKLGGTMESNYMTGDGQGKPLGLFTASSDGISTARDVSGDNTATAIKADTLITVQGTLKEAYQNKASWLFHRDTITYLRKLKDGDGQYLWQPGLTKGTQNMILGKPYKVSEWCPKTKTAGLYTGMYGDFSYYWILDCLNMTIKVLKELYAETNQIGYIGRYEGDGQPVLEEAFVRMKMGS